MDQRTETCRKCDRDRSPDDTTHQSYCRECWRDYQRDRKARLAQGLPATEPRSGVLVCADCTVEFTTTWTRTKPRFCGTCRAKRDRARSRRWQDRHPEYKARQAELNRIRHLRLNYGITSDEYDALLAEQDGRCAICGCEPEGRSRHVDHDHDTGRVRGILCDGCNRGLGCFGEDPVRLRAAIEYLERQRA